VKILGGQAESGSQSLFVGLGGAELGGQLGHGDALRAAILEANFHGQNACAGLLHHVDAAFLRRHHAELREQEPRAYDGMARQLQLLSSGKNAQARQSPFVGGLLHEDGFREIHFASDRLHFVLREAVAVGDDRERIALEAPGGENVDGIKTMFHG
jgi:hypothetical protein